MFLLELEAQRHAISFEKLLRMVVLSLLLTASCGREITVCSTMPVLGFRYRSSVQSTPSKIS
jgi:hypothetical protein